MAQQFSRNITLTSDLTTIAWGFRPHYVRIDGTTLNTAFLTFNSTQPATTNSSADSNSWQLTSGNLVPLVIQMQGVERNGMTSILTAIAATGATALIRVLAVRV